MKLINGIPSSEFARRIFKSSSQRKKRGNGFSYKWW